MHFCISTFTPDQDYYPDLKVAGTRIMKHNRAHYNAAITLWLLSQHCTKKQYKYQDMTLAYLLNISS